MKIYEFSSEERRIYESMQVPMVLYQFIDERIHTILVSDGFCQLKKYKRSKLQDNLNDNIFSQIHPEDKEKLMKVSFSFAKKLCPFDVLYRTRIPDDPNYHILHAVGKWQTMPDGTEVAFVFYNDMTQGMYEVDRLSDGYELFNRDRFYNDPTTRLPNLNYLHEYADDFCDKVRLIGKTPALLYFDVIGMQSYNNQYGYAKGDELLCLIAGVLKDTFPDALVTRGYDDHFFVVIDFESEEWLSLKIGQANEHIKEGAYGNTTGIHAGVCVIGEQMKVSDSIGHAKHALRTIENDLNITYSVFSNETDEAYWQQRYIIETFEKALKEEWIKIYYQCILRLKTGNACALEALARWIDPDRGMISPGVFVPILEKYHLLHKLDLYMVEQVCKEVVPRQELGLPIIPVSVNFSAQDFDYVDMVDEINKILEKYNVGRDKLIIEITEQDAALAKNSFREQVQKFHDSGYRIWMDDFGSGYSSLNVFSQYKFDLIKFDMALLQNIDNGNGANRHIFKAMVEVANALGIDTLAEGMETKEHLDFLNEVGFKMAQGFYYYKPESLESIAFKIKNGGPIVTCDLEWQ